jgi:hypothetical protein
VVEVADHPIFRGMGTELTFRRGVAGFFARGHHPVPPGAEVLTRLFGGEPATYLDRVSTAGTIVVQATSNLLSYCGQALVDWVVAEAAQRRAGAAGQRRGLAAVYGGSAQHHRTLTTPKYAQHLAGGKVYLPELADVDLTEYRGLLIPERLHRGQLERAADRIIELLDSGGTVIAFSGGEPLPEFLPGVRWQHRPTNFWWWLEPDADLGVRLADEAHPLFRRLTVRDCTWHYHGVLEPPEGAQALVTLTTGETLLYIDRVSTSGTMVVSTLDPISHYGGYFMPATERFLDAFLPWAAEMSRELITRSPREVFATRRSRADQYKNPLFASMSFFLTVIIMGYDSLMTEPGRVSSDLPELDRADDPRGGAIIWALGIVAAIVVAAIVAALVIWFW